ncbi:MAG: hypothetical protein LBL73_05370 [Synergistaceae bacterium]|jgi:hypothetical protein|nr:hypothetical protein [Synergistaceae bacterium]
MNGNRLTVKQLNDMDNLTFAICILSDRLNKLNRYAPLAQKIQKALRELEGLRDICRANPGHAAGIVSAKEAVYRAVYREYQLKDVQIHLGLDEFSEECSADLSGMEPEQVWNDKEIMDAIIDLMDNYQTGDYWDSVEYAIEHGIEYVLESREQ